MATRSFDLWTPTPTQATKAFAEMRDNALAGDVDATCAMALYGVLTQVVARLEALTAAVNKSNDSVEGPKINGKQDVRAC